MYTESKAGALATQFAITHLQYMGDVSFEPVQTKRGSWMIGICICEQIITQPYVNETFAIRQYFHKYHE